ncbi:M20/M25/M40 family metallo-hydrolase [Micromonospora sp. WMMA1923]|uniref:M20/M25/M40 family metallo-hydrolase n=1 Tax=Micromonospora sp. WMMA1923 TaxID=3404125 RepID=UPI003B95F943
MRRRLLTARWVPPLIATLVVVLALGGSLWVISPPAAVGSGAPADAFSADRALAQLDILGSGPRPTGSPAAAAVGDRLTARLTALGLRPETRRDTAARVASDGAHRVGRVANIHAVIPGREPGVGAVYLVAHHDSIPFGPGAADDGMGVLTILETARAVLAGPPLRHDVHLLFTDAEEAGLLGARAFVAAGLGDPDRTAVINLEARGNRGRAVMFETGGRSGSVVPALSGGSALATSMAGAVYQVLPNDTDFTEFRAAGYTGLNFALIDGSASYHTPHDTADRLDPGSVQDLGDQVLRATRNLADGPLRTDDAGEVSYFPLFGTTVSYPRVVDLVVAVLAAVLLLGAGVLALRRRVARGRATVLAASTLPLSLLGAAVVGLLLWPLSVLIRPALGGLVFSLPYRPLPYLLGLSLLAVAGTAGWLAVLRRRGVGGPELLLAAGAWFALLAVVASVLLPGAGYLFAWPALATGGAVLLLVLLGTDSPWRPVVLAVPAAVAVLLLTPVAVLVFPAVGLAAAVVPMLLVALLGAAVAPLGGRLPAGRPVLAGTLALTLGGLATLGVGLGTERVSVDRPAQVSLLYTVDLDTGTARWASAGGAPDAWVDRHVGDDTGSLEEDFPTLYDPGGYRTGPAPTVDLPAAGITVLGQRQNDDVRVVRLRLAVPSGQADMLALYADSVTPRLDGVTVDGAVLPGAVNRPFTDTPWRWGSYLFGVPAGGIEVELRIRGAEPLALRLLTYSAIGPAVAADPPPARVTWSADAAGEAITARTVRV